MRPAKKRRNNTSTTGMMLRTETYSTRPSSKSTKTPARSHHGRLASQSTPRLSHAATVRAEELEAMPGPLDREYRPTTSTIKNAKAAIVVPRSGSHLFTRRRVWQTWPRDGDHNRPSQTLHWPVVVRWLGCVVAVSRPSDRQNRTMRPPIIKVLIGLPLPRSSWSLLCSSSYSALTPRRYEFDPSKESVVRQPAVSLGT
jgi:hypothetical protein